MWDNYGHRHTLITFKTSLLFHGNNGYANVRRYTHTACPIITLKALHATDYPIPSTYNNKMRECHL